MYKINSHPYPIRQLILVVIIIFAVIFIGYWLEHHISVIEQWLEEMGHWAGAGFITLFVLLTPFFFSVDVLCVIAGALFSLPDAIAYVLIATMLAAALIFYIGRYLAKDKAQQILQKHPKLTIYDQLIAEKGFNIMFLLRLLPFPFALLSYVFAISRTRFLPYWMATTGIFFYNVVLVYFGYMAAHITDQLSQGQAYMGPHTGLLIGGVFGCILAMTLVSKIARARLANMHPEAPQSL